MSQIILTEQASAPSTPGSGKASLYITTAPELRLKDDAGNVITIPQVLNGSWTPTIAGDSTAGSQTYTTRVGRYTKVGTLVQASFFVVINAKDGATAGSIIITGLPFTSKNVSSYIQAGTLPWWATLATSVVHLGIDLPPNSTTARLYKTTAAAASVGNLVAADIQNGSSLMGTLVYEADA